LAALLLSTACGGASVKSTALVMSDPGLVSVEITPARTLVKAGHAGTLSARVRIKTRELPRNQSPPVNLGLVIDTSSSMEGAAIEDARAAARAVLDSMADGDRLSLVVFHSTAEVLVKSTVLDRTSRAVIARRIGEMVARGTTDLQSGLAQGVQQVAAALKSDGINRIVLLSDGVPNDASSVITYAQSAAQSGISITALGLGLEYDETLLAAVAQQSGGRFHFIRQSKQVAAVMREEVLQLRRVVARNMNLALTPGPGVAITGVVGQQPSQSGRVTYLPIGEMAQGEIRDIYLELTVGSHVAGAAVEITDAVLSFDDAVQSGGRLERRAFVAVKASADVRAVQDSADREVVREVERARASAATVFVISEARAGRLQAARSKLDDAEREARAQARKLGDSELTRLADSMDELRGALPSMVAPPAAVGTAAPPMPVSSPEQSEVIKRTHSDAVESLQRSSSN
jgi:Ca-activated chloride channel family protein